VLIGAASLLIAIIHGVAGPLDPAALVTRWVIIGLGAVIGAVGAAVREGQSRRLVQLDEAMTLRTAFERALAPSPVPPKGFVAVARYRPAEPGMQLGGDFLEAVGLRDGRLAVLIGDVCGHGPREAAFGAALRAGWKSIALGGKHDPVEWVEALNASFFQDGRIDTYVTLCTGYVDLMAGATRLVNAGHPLPVVLGPPVRLLDVPPSPPLGLGLADEWTATELAWRREPLLFYTDGVVENPSAHGRPGRWGVDGLLRWLEQDPLPPALDAAADHLLTAATAGREVRDDVALLVVGAA
jgi:serine phosphatase RsbU (regulator of sigma subunit)